jgi:hypothetical protein
MNTLPSTRSPMAGFPAMRWSPLLVVVALLAACGGDAPTTCGDSIPLQELTVRQTSLLQPCFEDPEDENLALSARSSDAGIATVIVLGQAIRIKAVSPGNATVTVTAEDPGGQTVAMDIEVLVPNQPPLPKGDLDAIRMLVGGKAQREVDAFFTEPDEQDLVFSASSSDPAVARAEIVDSIKLLVTGLSLGTATVTVTATDPGGLTAIQTLEVAVLEPVQVVYEDFEDGSNGDFLGNFATTTSVVDGVMRVTNRYNGYWGWAERSNVNAVEWEWKGSIGQVEDGEENIPGFMAENASGSNPQFYNMLFGSSEYAQEWQGTGEADYMMMYWAPGWTTEGSFWGEADVIGDVKPGEFFEASMTNRSGELTVMVGSTLLMKVDLLARNWADGLANMILATISGTFNVYAAFDWVELNGLEAGDLADWHEGPSELPGIFTTKPGVDGITPSVEILK